MGSVSKAYKMWIDTILLGPKWWLASVPYRKPPMMKLPLSLLLVLVIIPILFGAEPSKSIADLSSPDVNVRRKAIDAIQTLDDPAIPAACLPLLKDEGFSIRRQAARAIGSRFSDITKDQRKTYVDALKTCAKEGPEDVTLICQRAIGLLTENYRFPSFSVGPKKKWLLYERRRLPVIAPLKGGPHTLVSPVAIDFNGKPDLLKMEVTNESAQELFDPHWHPGGEALAFTMKLQRRFYTPVCIWSATSDKIMILEARSLKGVLPSRYPAWGTTTEFARWDGDKAVVRIYDCDDGVSSTPPVDSGVFVSYDLRSGKTERVK